MISCTFESGSNFNLISIKIMLHRNPENDSSVLVTRSTGVSTNCSLERNHVLSPPITSAIVLGDLESQSNRVK